MPRQMYSDNYIKSRHAAEEDEGNLERAKLEVSQALSEERQAERWKKKEREQENHAADSHR